MIMPNKKKLGQQQQSPANNNRFRLVHCKQPTIAERTTMSAFEICHTLEIDSCPFCKKIAKGPSARSSINRHIKMAAKKPSREANDPHPFEDDEQFEIVAKDRGFYSKIKGANDKITRRAATQKKPYKKERQKSVSKLKPSSSR